MIVPVPSATLRTLDLPQVTLRRPVQAEGTGVHTGHACRVTIEPAGPDEGIVFGDADGSFRLSASRWIAAARCTMVGDGRLCVQTVEHLLAALSGLMIDNVRIMVDGPEVPILDGSAQPWVDRILEAGTVELDAPAVAYVIREPVAVECGEARAAAAPHAALALSVTTDYQHPMLGKQTYTAELTREAFIRDLAPARTFALAEEVEHVLARGLARGADLSNTLLVYADHYSDALRVDDECLKHKVLDVLGDLCVLGRRLHATITVHKPGHAVNAQLVQRLAGLGCDPLI